MFSRLPFLPKWHNCMKTVQSCWNPESRLMRHWNFTALGHVIGWGWVSQSSLTASHLYPPSATQCPQDEPGDASCVSAKQWHHFQRKQKQEVFEGVSVWADLHDQIRQQSLSLACLASQMLFKDLWWAVLAMHLFIFYSHTPYVGAISNISKLPFNHVLRCLFGALRYLLWLRWHFHYKLLFSVVYNFPPKLPLRVEIFLRFLINRPAVNLFRKLEDNLHSSFGAIKTSGEKTQTNQTQTIFDH